jgi:hypothetical protein
MQVSIKQAKEVDQPEEDQRVQTYRSMFASHLEGGMGLHSRSRASSVRRILAASVSQQASKLQGCQVAPLAPARSGCERPEGSNMLVACEASAVALSEVPLTPGWAEEEPTQEQSPAISHAVAETDHCSSSMQETIVSALVGGLENTNAAATSAGPSNSIVQQMKPQEPLQTHDAPAGEAIACLDTENTTNASSSGVKPPTPAASGSSTPRSGSKLHTVSFMPALPTPGHCQLSDSASTQMFTFDSPLTPGRDIPLAQRLVVEDSPVTSTQYGGIAGNLTLGNMCGSMTRLAPSCVHDGSSMTGSSSSEASARPIVKSTVFRRTTRR